MTPKYNYTQLIGWGFSRHESHDEVLYEETGYSGFHLSLEFPNLGVGVSTPSFIQTEKPRWEFTLYKVDNGDIIRKIHDKELRGLIRFMRHKEREIVSILREVNGAIARPI